MSLQQYNLTPYNRKTVETDAFEANYRIYTTLTANVSVDVEYVMNYRINTDLGGEMNLQYFYNEQYLMAQDAGVAVSPHFDINWKPKLLDAQVGGTVNMAIPAVYRVQGGVEATARVQWEIVLAPNLFALLTVAVDSLLTADEEMVFANLVLKPNETLVIDSEVFMVTHNNENILEKYEGKWPFFDRRLDGVEVVGVSRGTASVSILYQERYL
jgi:hypothetical protein